MKYAKIVQHNFIPLFLLREFNPVLNPVGTLYAPHTTKEAVA